MTAPRLLLREGGGTGLTLSVLRVWLQGDMPGGPGRPCGLRPCLPPWPCRGGRTHDPLRGHEQWPGKGSGLQPSVPLICEAPDAPARVAGPPVDVTWSGLGRSARSSPLQRDRREPAFSSSWSSSASPGSSSLLSPPPDPRAGFRAPRSWASGSLERLCSQASVGGGKRVWPRQHATWVAAGGLPCPPGSAPAPALPQGFKRLPRPAAPTRALKRLPTGLTASPGFWALPRLPHPGGTPRAPGGRAGQVCTA